MSFFVTFVTLMQLVVISAARCVGAHAKRRTRSFVPRENSSIKGKREIDCETPKLSDFVKFRLCI